jgi:multicomponent Na+:H+ antiporter subunit B
MRSLILMTATRFLLPLLLLFSIFLLLRGHNAPGGGFAGGLVVASAFALYGFAFGVSESRRLLGVQPRTLVGAGLLVALFSALISLLRGQPLMTGQWTSVHVPMIGPIDVGTPILFDIGVYLVVIGVANTVLMTLAEE